jgi:hypothetical protein
VKPGDLVQIKVLPRSLSAPDLHRPRIVIATEGRMDGLIIDTIDSESRVSRFFENDLEVISASR